MREALAESQRAQEELTNALSILEATLESTTDGLLVVDREGRIVRMNRRFAELWRIPQDVLASRDDAKALAYVLEQLEDPAGFLQKVQELYANPEAESFDTLRFKDGRVFERYSQPHRIKGVTTGRVWSFRDVTSRLQLEDQLRQSQKMEAIGQLAGGVAHDFNNLLTVICGHAEFLQREHLTPGQQHDLEQIHRAAMHAAALTGQLLAFGRKQIVRPVLLDLNDVVAELEPMLRRLIGEDIAVDVCPSRAEAAITADRCQVEQILINLAINARDAMPRGGRLSLRLGHVELVHDAARTGRAGFGSYVRLTVTDTGEGIPPEILDRIFEPFFTTKERGRGTGLGLATVYGIVEQSGGFIEVQSTVGVGSRFDVYLPAAEGSAHTLDVREDHRAPANGTETILVVEDEEPLRRMLRRVLEQRGYTVFTAESGRDALKLTLDHDGEIDLVVTDVVMPTMSGPQFAEHLRIARPHVPVIYVSGYTDDEISRRGLVRSNTVILAKPFSPDRLANTVRDVLRQSSPHRSPAVTKR